MVEPGPPSEPTVGELGRTLERFIHEVDRRFNELGGKIDSKLVNADYYNARHDAMDARLKAVERDFEQFQLDRRSEQQTANTNNRQLILLILSNLIFPLMIGGLIASGSIRVH